MKISNTEHYNQLQQLCDAELQSEDGYSYDVHRFQLAKNSNYFRALFCGDLSKNRRKFILPGISGECLGDILCYLYTKEVSVTEHNILDLLVAADYLLLPDLYQNVKERVKACLTAANSLRLFTVAEIINDTCVLMLSFRYIQTHFEDIVQTKGNGLTDLPIDVLQKILSNSSIYIRSEFTVWHVIVEWINGKLTDRLKYTPRLLALLARKEVNEKLATDVLQYNIINRNTFVCGLDDMITCSEFSSNLEILDKFLENSKGMQYRIPPELHVVIIKAAEIHDSSPLYLSYDENIDLWRKIGEVNFYPEYLITISHNIFVFGREECLKIDLSSQLCFPLRNFRNSIRNFSIVHVDGKLYVLGEVHFNYNYWPAYNLEVYHPNTDLWFSSTCPSNVSNAIAVAMSKKIYVVGYTPDFHEMVAEVFDTECWLWSNLPSPNIYRTAFCMVAFREYLYLVGGSSDSGDATKVEIFDTKVKIWIEIPDIPHAYWWIDAVIWKDQIVVFDNADDWYKSENTVCWNEEKKGWEAFDKSSPIDLRSHLFSSIRDVNSVLTITRRNRGIDNKIYRRIFV